MGYYALAFTWGSFICWLLQVTVNTVLMPTLAAIQHDPAALRRWYLKTMELLATHSFLGKGSNHGCRQKRPWRTYIRHAPSHNQHGRPMCDGTLANKMFLRAEFGGRSC